MECKQNGRPVAVWALSTWPRLRCRLNEDHDQHLLHASLVNCQYFLNPLKCQQLLLLFVVRSLQFFDHSEEHGQNKAHYGHL